MTNFPFPSIWLKAQEYFGCGWYVVKPGFTCCILFWNVKGCLSGPLRHVQSYEIVIKYYKFLLQPLHTTHLQSLDSQARKVHCHVNLLNFLCVECSFLDSDAYKIPVQKLEKMPRSQLKLLQKYHFLLFHQSRVEEILVELVRSWLRASQSIYAIVFLRVAYCAILFRQVIQNTQQSSFVR